jgi:hypothetical protein
MKSTKIILFLIAFGWVLPCRAQVTNTATLDTTDINLKGKLSINAYIDAYYGYDFSNPPDGNRAYFVSMNRHNEFNINLAFVDVKYTSSRFRARFVPGFGTYINANYAQEPGVLKNIVEGYVGMKLAKNKEIWLDMGVLGSPYTNESAISKDHLMYTRSFAPEYVPYYLSGLKLSVPLSPKVNAYFYLLNGWQVIQDNNPGKSLGTQLEWRPNDKLLINWDTYLGNEQTTANPTFRTRYFSDIYMIYNPSGKFSGTACVYAGWQEQANNAARSKTTATWWNANLIGRYRFSPQFSVSGRLEYFNDEEQVFIQIPNSLIGFSSFSSALCFNYTPIDNVLFRLESRNFLSRQNVYRDLMGKPFDRTYLLIMNATVFF